MFTYTGASVNVLIVEPVLVVEEIEAELRASGFHSKLGTTTLDLEQPVPICLLFVANPLNPCIIT